MPTGLKRYYGTGHLHYITCSCYRRRKRLGTARRRDAFARVLEQVRQKFGFVVVGYLVMPEHFHLLMSEPELGDPSKVMQVLKQRVARRLLRPRGAGQAGLWEEEPEDRQFWQRRFYDFNVWSKRKRIEKLNYMHANPVRRKLVERPELWAWSSYPGARPRGRRVGDGRSDLAAKPAGGVRFAHPLRRKRRAAKDGAPSGFW